MEAVLALSETTLFDEGRQHRLLSSRKPNRSRFETLAMLSVQPSALGKIRGVLLASTCPVQHAGSSVLQPIWAEEAMHRSCTMMRLLNMRGRRGSDPATNRNDLILAHDLAAGFRSLEVPPSDGWVSCSDSLRHVVTDLVALLDSARDIMIETHIERLRLPAFKRRALVLATAELVMNVLLHAFPRYTPGRIKVNLTLSNPLHARLQVTDNGVGFRCGQPDLTCGVAARLADLLEADLTYYRTPALTIAEIVFPIDADTAHGSCDLEIRDYS